MSQAKVYNLPRESLSDIAKRLRKAVRDADDATLAVAREVMSLANRWDDYREEAGGRTFERWLAEDIDEDRGFTWYKGFADACERHVRLRTGLEERLDAASVKWTRNIASDSDLVAVAPSLSAMWVSKGRIRLRLTHVRKVCAKYTRRAAAKESLRKQLDVATGRVKRLEAQVKGLGAEPVE